MKCSFGESIWNSKGKPGIRLSFTAAIVEINDSVILCIFIYFEVQPLVFSGVYSHAGLVTRGTRWMAVPGPALERCPNLAVGRMLRCPRPCPVQG